MISKRRNAVKPRHRNVGLSSVLRCLRISVFLCFGISLSPYLDTPSSPFGISVSPYLGISKVYASDKLYFIHTDHLGSTVAITDEDGEIVSQNRHFPYGGDRLSAVSGQLSATERNYTSQIKDNETQLYYYNARYYDPALGVFVSADPVGDSLNRYGYVHGNPLRGIDPTGRQMDLTNPGPTVDTTPGIAASGTYVGTVASTSLENAYVSDYDPTALDRAVLYGVAGAGALISGGMLITALPEAALASFVYATTYAPGAVAVAGTAAKVLGGAIALHQAASCLSGDQGACGNLVTGYQIYMNTQMAGALAREEVTAGNKYWMGKLEEAAGAVRSTGYDIQLISHSEMKEVAGAFNLETTPIGLRTRAGQVFLDVESSSPRIALGWLEHEWSHVEWEALNNISPLVSRTAAERVSSEIFAFSRQASAPYLPAWARGYYQGRLDWFSGMSSAGYSAEAVISAYGSGVAPFVP